MRHEGVFAARQLIVEKGAIRALPVHKKTENRFVGRRMSFCRDEDEDGGEDHPWNLGPFVLRNKLETPDRGQDALTESWVRHYHW